MYVATLTLFVFLFQSDILDVNQIFKDLGTMVYEQGEMIGKWRLYNSSVSVNQLKSHLNCLSKITVKKQQCERILPDKHVSAIYNYNYPVSETFTWHVFPVTDFCLITSTFEHRTAVIQYVFLFGRQNSDDLFGGCVLLHGLYTSSSTSVK